MLVQIARSCRMQAAYGGHHEIFSYMSASWNSTRGNPRVALWDRMALWSISIKKGYRFGTGEPLKKKEQFHIQWDKGLPYALQRSSLKALCSAVCTHMLHKLYNLYFKMLQGMGFWYFIIHGFSIFSFKTIFSTTKFHAWHEEVFIDFNPFAHLSRPPWTYFWRPNTAGVADPNPSPPPHPMHTKTVSPRKKGDNIQLEKKWWPLKILKKHLVYIYI